MQGAEPTAVKTPLKLNTLIEGRAEGIRNRLNEGVLPPQPTPVDGNLSQFVEGWKSVTNDPYVLSSVAKGYRHCFMSPSLLCKTPYKI